MARPDDGIVLKYCELLDEFIRIRCTSDDDTRRMLSEHAVRNRAEYHDLVVHLCVVDYDKQVLPLFERHTKVYQTEALVELLYQICIEVNPHLEIHSVTLPGEGGEGGPLQTLDPADALPMTGDELAVFQTRARDIEAVLAQRVVGQPCAVTAVSRAVKKAAVGLKDPRKPIGVFLLVGPTGTGKTELAKVLTRQLFGSLGSLVRIDCSEYALPHEYAKLIGAPPGYIGHNEGGQLTEAVKKHGTCVVLFDEVEKAHEKVHNLLLQLMDEGTLTDSKGEVVSFRRCIVLMTSNIGVKDVSRLADRVGFGAKGHGTLDDSQVAFTVTEAVKRSFRPEFINRIDEIVQFRPLSVRDCEEIAQLQLDEMAGYLSRTGVDLHFTSSLCKHLARLGWSAEYGARELRRMIRDEVEDDLTERLMAGEFGSGDSVTITVRGKKGKVVMGCGRSASRHAAGTRRAAGNGREDAA
ncbi:MAG: ATP-dependent Clp protease ATP-binding subunit [Planctomycetes bacterium]|nr:ATP-dependent Clp protease ATP-binding subunit [Planctomycetota bacterium]